MKLQVQVVQYLSKRFGDYGLWLMRNQTLVVIVVSLSFVVFTLGTTLITFEDDAAYLFVPHSTQASEEREKFRNLFGFNGSSRADIIFLGSGSDRNLWRKERLRPILELHHSVMENQNEFGKKLEEICEEDAPGRCRIQSILGCIGFEIPEGNAPLPEVEYPRCISPYNQTIKLPVTVSEVVISETGIVEQVEVLRITYFPLSRTDDQIKQAESWEVKAFLEYLDNEAKVFNKQNKGEIQVVYNSRLGLDRSLNDGQTEDLRLVGFSFVFVAGFAILASSNLGSGDAQHRILPAQASIILSLSAVGPAFGTMSYFGVPFIALNGVILFLTIGIGIDDMFILVASFNRQPLHLSPAERIGKTMEESGVTITITTVTDILAFIIGIASPFRAIQIFCAYAALSLFWVYVLQISVFLIVLAYDAERDRTDGRLMASLKQVLAKLRRKLDDASTQRGTSKESAAEKGHKSQTSDPPESVGESNGATDDAGCRVVTEPSSTGSTKASVTPTETSRIPTATHPERVRRHFLRILFMLPPHDYVWKTQDLWIASTSKWIFTRKLFYALFFIMYALYIGFSIYGILNLDEGLRVSQLAADSSHVTKFDPVDIKYFRERNGIPVHVAVHQPVEYNLKKTREEFQRLAVHMRTQAETLISTDPTWVEAFEDAVASYNENKDESNKIADDMTESEFRMILHQMLTESPYGADLRSKLSLQRPSGTLYEAGDIVNPVSDLADGEDVRIVASFATLRSKPLAADTEKEVKAMRESRDAASSFDTEVFDGNSIFVHSESFFFAEQFAAIVPATILLLSTAAIAMLGVALVLLPSITAALVVVFGLLSIFAGVVGFMHHWGLTLNTVTMVNLLIAIGFSIDFTAHTCHSFLHSPGYRRVLGSHLDGLFSEGRAKPETRSLNEEKSNSQENSEPSKECQAEVKTLLISERPTTEYSIYSGIEGYIGGISRKLRAAQTLTNVGRPIFNGGISTILGILLLAAGSTFIFRSFFRVLFLVLVLGLIHGIVVIPVILSLVGPQSIFPRDPHEDSQPEKEPAKGQDEMNYIEQDGDVSDPLS
eukprot:gb/GECG01002633.1/.p1 GENE.gb/GECG01002633.1/~~gb/GECG01002633.1/.p1  ORF type:complete len:1061 (+),score=104.52 gb/GECG01002633.1/:1-3183(+)